MRLTSVQDVLDSAREFVESVLCGSARYRQAVYLYIRRFQHFYGARHAGEIFLEGLDRTDLVRHFLDDPAVRCLSRNTLRLWLSNLKRFSGWLLEHERIENDVLFYLDVERVLDDGVPALWLRTNLQSDILRFRRTLDGLHASLRSTCLWAAHAWNTHLNQLRGQADPLEDAVLWHWLAGLIRVAPSLARAQSCLLGLEHFLDYLAVSHGCSTHAVRRFRARYRSRTEALRLLRCGGVVDACAVEEALEPLLRKPYFLSGLHGWFDAWLAHLAARQRNLNTPRVVLRVLDRVLVRHGIHRPDQIAADVVSEFLEKGSPSARTQAERLTVLRGFERFIRSRGEPISCSLQPDILPSVAPSPFRPHIFSVRQVGLILRAIRQHGDASPHPLHWLGASHIIFLLYACGMRLSEPLKLRLEEVDLERRVLLVACTKFYKQRWVPFGTECWRRLVAYREQRDRAWPQLCSRRDPFFLNLHGRPYSPQSLQALFRHTIDKLGIASRGTRPPRLHDLRHSSAVHRLYKWYADGADVQNKLPLLSTYLGHAKIISTQVYLHLTEDLLRQAGRGFEAAFEQIVAWPADPLS